MRPFITASMPLPSRPWVCWPRHLFGATQTPVVVKPFVLSLQYPGHWCQLVPGLQPFGVITVPQPHRVSTGLHILSASVNTAYAGLGTANIINKRVKNTAHTDNKKEDVVTFMCPWYGLCGSPQNPLYTPKQKTLQRVFHVHTAPTCFVRKRRERRNEGTKLLFPKCRATARAEHCFYLPK